LNAVARKQQQRSSFPFHLFYKEFHVAKVLYVNNDGGGFADYIEVAEGTTVQKLFAERVPHGRPQDYLIRVNRQSVAADQVLQEGDRVSFTPTKIEGTLT
jgi:sulfur carrier protein ThiS